MQIHFYNGPEGEDYGPLHIDVQDHVHFDGYEIFDGDRSIAIYNPQSMYFRVYGVDGTYEELSVTQ